MGITIIVVTSMLVLMLIRKFLVIATIQGKSMYPTLDTGDRVLVLTFWPPCWLRRGQIIVCDISRTYTNKSLSAHETDSFLSQSPNASVASLSNFTVQPTNKSQSPGISSPPKLIKRIVGLPGDIMYIPKSSLHPVIQEKFCSDCDPKGNMVWRVPCYSYFVRGDGILSVDSVVYGPLPFRSFVGLVLLRLLPHDK